ncbi:helix-turn-helix transcriptional regulator [Conexibacter woesei]|uniref:Transcriptional regulator, LuxR family n=1 Tax=Conexibacter woesei (strain DSM 14684 / CCUG 47730 / CIP 108061 / JCM 11494 / NBRC 100937 / ID131577) TaxID=469383 RepID=D3F0R1_CONWI|nr:LuxR family transcriptional regulator [Conexibacter woesei]ADB53995.1 transcriptional regulator, LuxR family [Conexibacter woesei DSM 14684]
MLERDRELAEIGGAIADARAGRGRLLLVEGAAGSGKSTLVRAARERAAQDGLRVLRAAAGEFEREYAFGCVRQLFEPFLHGLPGPERARLLAGAAAPAEWIVAPAGDAPSAERTAAGFAALNAIYWLISNVAEAAPLLIAVDDVHWADDASIQALGHLGRRIEDLPIALVVALRPEEPDAPAALIDGLRAVAGDSRVVPRPLSEAAVSALVRAHTPAATDAVCAACHAESAGNPLYLRELLRTLDGDGALGPDVVAAASVPTLAARVERRVAKVGPEAPTLAYAMAVLGDGGALPLAAQLAGVEPTRAARIARRLCEIEVLAAEDPFAFVHPLVRRSVYDSLSLAERDAAHAAAARLLETAGAPAEAVAAHLAATRPTGSDAVAAALLAAAETSSSRAAPEAAIRLLRRALEEDAAQPSRPVLLHRLGLAEMAIRDPQCVEHISQAVELADEPPLRIAATVALAELLATAGQWGQARALLSGALDGLDDPELLVQVEAIHTVVAVNDPHLVGDFEREREHFERLAHGPSWAAQALTAALAAQAVQRCEDAAQARALAERALARGVLTSGRPAGGWAGAQLFMALVYSEAYDRALDVAEEIEREGRRHGELLGLIGGRAFRSQVVALLGDLAAAEADLRTLLDLLGQANVAMWTANLFYVFLDTLLERPGVDDVSAIAETLELDPTFLGTMTGGLLLAGRGRLRLERGERAAALADLEAAGLVLSPLRTGPSQITWRSDLARVLPPERRDEALGLVEEEVALARRLGLPRTLGVALRGAGLVEGGVRGIETLRESVAALEESEARLEHARSLVELGAALRRARQRVQAREQLAAGIELAHRCGAQRLVARAREELLAAGGRPRRIARTGAEALTVSQLRVARLAVAGQTNVEIAQELYVSVKTVETHLSHAYGKLGLAGQGARADLQRFLLPRLHDGWLAP